MDRRSTGVAVLAVLAFGCATNPPLDVADAVDLDRFVGRWYEIASFPQRFQQGCVATTATYSRRDDGRIRVVNECRDGSFDGDLRRVEGVAWVADPEKSSARLEVQFFWPFRGDYWIVDLDPDYRWAVVGHPDRTYGWILSRTPGMDEKTYEAILGRLREQAYDTARFGRTLQPAG